GPPDAPMADGSSDGSTGQCLTSGWDQLALDGTIWSIDNHVAAYGQFAGIVRFDGSGASLVATYNGSPASMTVQPAGALSWTRNAVPMTSIRRRVFAACTRPSADEIAGDLTACDMMGGCTQGTFRMVRLARRPGEGESSPNVTKLAEYQGASW